MKTKQPIRIVSSPTPQHAAAELHRLAVAQTMIDAVAAGRDWERNEDGTVKPSLEAIDQGIREQPAGKPISMDEAVGALQWLESFYAEDSPAGASARCVGGIIRGMSRVYDIEHPVNGGTANSGASHDAN